MTRPLHKDAVQCPKSRPSDGHAGLWFDKFCDQWRVRDESWTMKSETGDGNNPKLNWINTFTNGQVGTARQIDEYALRLRRLVERRRGRAAEFTTEARFVPKLGRSHSVEDGFAWHRDVRDTLRAGKLGQGTGSFMGATGRRASQRRNPGSPAWIGLADRRLCVIWMRFRPLRYDSKPTS